MPVALNVATEFDRADGSGDFSVCVICHEGHELA